MPISYLNHYQDHLQRIAEYEDIVARLTALGFTLNQVNTVVANAFAGIGVQPDKYLAPFIPVSGNFNIWAIDLIYLLGARPWGFEAPGSDSVQITTFPSSFESGTNVSGILSPSWQSEFYYSVPFGVNPVTEFSIAFSGKKINPSGIALQIPSIASQRSVTLVFFGKETPTSPPLQLGLMNIDSQLQNEQWISVEFTPTGLEFEMLVIRSAAVNPANNKHWISGKQLKIYGELTL